MSSSQPVHHVIPLPRRHLAGTSKIVPMYSMASTLQAAPRKPLQRQQHARPYAHREGALNASVRTGFRAATEYKCKVHREEMDTTQLHNTRHEQSASSAPGDFSLGQLPRQRNATVENEQKPTKQSEQNETEGRGTKLESLTSYSTCSACEAFLA